MAHEVNIHVGATEDAKGAFDKVAGYLKSLRKEAAASGEHALAGVLSRGPAGLAEAGLQSLGLGIAGIIAEQVGEAAEKGTEKLVEMQEALRQDKANAADFANEFFKSIPILGSFVGAFENIRELITGDKEEIARMNEEAELTTKYYEAQARFAHETKLEHMEQLELMTKLAEQAKLAGMVGFARTKEERESSHNEYVANEAAVVAQQKNKLDSSELKNARSGLEGFDEKNGSRIADLRDILATHDESVRKGIIVGGDDARMKSQRKELQDLLDDRATIQAKIVNIDGELNKKRSDLDQASADRIKQHRDTTDKLEQEDAKKHGYKLEDAEYEHQERVKEIQAEAAKARFEAGGQQFAAERAALEESRRKQLDDIESRRSKSTRDTDNPDEINQINKDAWAEAVGANETFNEQTKALNEKQAAESRNATAEAAEAQKDAEAEAQADRLKRLNRTGEAEIVLIKRDGAKRIDEIKRQAEEEARTHADTADSIRAKAQAEAAKTQSETDERVREEILRMYGKQGEFRLSGLQEVGATTGVAARAREENDPARMMLQQAMKADAVAQSQRQTSNTTLDKIATFLQSILGGNGKRIFPGSAGTGT